MPNCQMSKNTINNEVFSTLTKLHEIYCETAWEVCQDVAFHADIIKTYISKHAHLQKQQQIYTVQQNTNPYKKRTLPCCDTQSQC